MMRIVVAFLALVLLGGAAPVDFTRTIMATPEGGFRMGNPAAKVKLVEYASLTCPHCRAFHVAGSALLERDYVAKGLVSFELRNLVLNGPDLAASTLARCQGTSKFFSSVDVFFRQQQVWIQPFTQVAASESARYAALPDDQQLAAVAVGGKLDQFVAKFGMSRALFDSCLADQNAVARLTKIGEDAGRLYKVQGTPTFFINGRVIPTNTWAGVEPLLRRALGLVAKTGRK
jgi:protein-disulfide isomerase